MAALAWTLKLEQPFAALDVGTLAGANRRLTGSHRLSARAAHKALDLLPARDVDEGFSDGAARFVLRRAYEAPVTS
jgi:hypothetical protein